MSDNSSTTTSTTKPELYYNERLRSSLIVLLFFSAIIGVILFFKISYNCLAKKFCPAQIQSVIGSRPADIFHRGERIQRQRNNRRDVEIPGYEAAVGYPIPVEDIRIDSSCTSTVDPPTYDEYLILQRFHDMRVQLSSNGTNTSCPGSTTPYHITTNHNKDVSLH